CWSPVAGADHYEIWVNDLTTGKSQVVHDQNAPATSWAPTIPLTSGDSFRWWVRAVNSTSTATGPWSAPLSFTISALAAPSLVGPGTPITSVQPTFTWKAVAGADSYDIWVDDVTTGQSAVLRDHGVTSTTWVPTTPLHVGHAFRWWVRAVDSTATNNGPWSSPLNF